MFVSSIICEYNPFHNGHKYQIERTRESGATHIIAVMSGNFVQRGETSIIDKHTRAEIAVRNGADLVIELPAPYSFSNAEFFAKSAIYIINKLGICDTLSFGTECGNIMSLKKAASITEQYKNDGELKKLLSEGMPYPKAISTIIKSNHEDNIAEVFDTPNNMLGIEYIKALNYFKSPVLPFTIQRKEVMHDSDKTYGQFASASLIRSNIIKNNDYKCFVPPSSYNIIQQYYNKNQVAFFANLNNIFLYRLYFMSRQEMYDIPDITTALADRLYNASRQAKALDELINLTKTKCFTHARIRRILCYALLNIKNEDLITPPQYARILAFNNHGCELLDKINKSSDFNISTSLAVLEKINSKAKRQAEIDTLASDLFSLAINNNDYRKNEYKVKVAKI